MMRFSVVIPAYNYGHLIARAVSSACTQVGDDYEVIVVDDGSNDDTPAVLERLQTLYPTLRVIPQTNAGPAAVRNRGVEVSKGEYLIFLDADDEFEPKALAIFREGANTHPEAGLLIAPTVSVYPDGRVKDGKSVFVATHPEQRFLDYLYKRLPISNGAVAMHRKVFGVVGYNPDLRQTEDIPVFAQCLANFEAVGLAEPTTRIHKHDDSRRHNVDAALSLGMTLVDEVFDANRLPAPIMKHRNRYQARRALSVFRLCYRAGRYREAREYFAIACRSQLWEVLGRPQYLAKYARCLANR